MECLIASSSGRARWGGIHLSSAPWLCCLRLLFTVGKTCDGLISETEPILQLGDV